MRKVLSILALSLLTIQMFSCAKPGGYGSYPPPNDGDWVITNETLVENETIVLNGNLIVETGGNLTLRNVTLRMNCAENGSYHIEIKNGSELYIYGSNITSNTPDGEHRFNFWVREGAKFEINNSELHECGYYINYRIFKTMGLFIETDNIKISNSLFSNNYDGILIVNSSHVDISESIFEDNMDTGLEFRNSDNNLIINCIIKNNEFGLVFYHSHNNIISNNQLLDNNVFGVVFREMENIYFINNVLRNNTFGGAIIFGSALDSIFKNNTFLNNNFSFGFDETSLDFLTNLTIDTSNTIDASPIYFLSNLKDIEISPETGYEKIGYLAIVDSENVTINNLILCNNSQGLLLVNTNYSKIYNINFNDNMVGISLLSSSYNQVNNCNFINNAVGLILISNSDNNMFQNCEIINNSIPGIWLVDSSNNTINNCNISKGKGGIEIVYGENNTIQNCNIDQQDEYGLYIVHSSRNNIFFNNFISNNIHAIDNGSGNHWDNGKAGGNYWDDYTGLDNGSNNRIKDDGIGDTNLLHLGLDYYPFMEKEGWLNYTPQDTDGDEIPDLIDPDIDGDGFPNEEDAYPYDKNKWRTEEVESNWTIVLGAMVILTIGVIILGIVLTLLSRKKRGN